jgi:hypothetical protein
MEQNLVVKAVLEALGDPKVVAAFAEAVGKKVVEQKSKPGSQEDSLVIDHIVFAEASDSKGTYMIAKEIEEALLEINPDFDIRTRTFGKSLLTHALDVKQTNKGRAYFVKAIVDDMKKFAAEMDVEAPTNESKEAKKDKKADKGKDKSEKDGKDKKKDKKKDKDSSEDEDATTLTPATPAEAFEPPIDVAQLIEMVSGYDTVGEFHEHLAGMSLTKLIKLINKHKLPIITSDTDEDGVVNRIVDLLLANLPKDNPVVVAEVEAHVKGDKKKDKKSEKSKDKKKDKGIDNDALAEVGKKKDKKKDKKKK